MDTTFLKQQLKDASDSLKTIPIVDRPVAAIHAQVIAETLLETLEAHPEQVMFDLSDYQSWKSKGIGDHYIQYVCRSNGHNIEVHDTVGVCPNCLEMGKELQDNV